MQNNEIHAAPRFCERGTDQQKLNSGIHEHEQERCYTPKSGARRDAYYQSQKCKRPPDHTNTLPE